MRRKCLSCGVLKELNERNFSKKASGKNGFDSRCKSCKQKRDRKRYRKMIKEEREARESRIQVQRTKPKPEKTAQKEAAVRERERLAELREKASQGDLDALQDLALERGDMLEYWRLYKEKILESEREFNRVGRHLVGGIDIHEEDFEQQVVDQLKKQKQERRN